ncbi:MAG: hypothetical protein PHU63_00880 [Candidatus ainarchaeum sp.]|nr:hypothetical protein [Candidatus ainarchaeum sp.]
MVPRGKRIHIDMEIRDDVIDHFKNLDTESIKKSRAREEKSLVSSVSSVFDSAQKLYKTKAKEEDLQRNRLYSVQDAYDYLKGRGLYLSFRAFGGRIERGTIPFAKVGRKRYIPQVVLDDILSLGSSFYTVKDAFEEYKKHNKKINYRAFIGRVEKGSVPSVKIGTRRLIPRDAVEALTHVSKDYYSVSESLDKLGKKGIRIRRNAFERRLDRGRIPCTKVGGRRFIHHDVLEKLISLENDLRERRRL